MKGTESPKSGIDGLPGTAKAARNYGK